MSSETSDSTISAIGLTLDCLDPKPIADFWQAVIGFTKRVGDGDPYITLSESPVGRPLNHLTIQRVPEDKLVKNRVHLDLFARDLEAEVQRVTALGASVLHRDATGEEGHLGFLAVVLADPEGHEFCIVGRPPQPAS